jgi:hypothetical protein
MFATALRLATPGLLLAVAAGALLAPSGHSGTLVAQAAPGGVGDWIDTLIKSGGALGVLGFYLYYRLTVADPREQKAARDERAAMAQASEVRLDKLMAAHQETVTAFSTAATRMADLNEKMVMQCGGARPLQPR